MGSRVLDRVWEIPTQLAALEAQVAALRFAQLELVGELDRLVPVGFPDVAREEVAVACRVSDTEARRRLDTARALTAPAGADGSVGEAAAGGDSRGAGNRGGVVGARAGDDRRHPRTGHRLGPLGRSAGAG